MPELTVTPDPSSRPPSVRVRVDADEDTLITNAQVRRDGELVRGSVADRTPRLVIDDYEAPYATEVEYSVEGESVPTDVPLIDEVWDDLAEWDGDTGDWVLPTGTHPVAVNLVEDPFMDDGAYWEVSYLDFPSPDFDTSVPSELVSTPVEMVSGSTVYDVNAVGCVVDSGQGDQFWVNIDARSDFGGYVLLAYWGLDSSGGTVEGGSLLASAPSDGAWHTLSAPFTVSDASVVSAAVYLTHYGAPGTVGDLHVRHPILTRGSDPVDFFTGDSEDTARWTYEWSGTPGESTSLKFDNRLSEELKTVIDGSQIELDEPFELPFNTVEVNSPANVRVELIEIVEGDEGEPDTGHVCASVTTSDTRTLLETDEETSSTNGTGTYTISLDNDNGEVVVSGSGWEIRATGNCEPKNIRISSAPDGHHFLRVIDTWAIAPEDRIAASDEYLFVLNHGDKKIHRFDLDGSNEMSWSLPGAGSDISVDGEMKHVWVTDYDNNAIHGYEPDGTLEKTIEVQSPVVVRDNSILAVTRTVSSNPFAYIADIDSGKQYFNLVDQHGERRNHIGTRNTSHGFATHLTAPGEQQGDMWAAIPDAGVIRVYRYQGSWKVGARTNWPSEAADIAVAPDGPSSVGWLKFELWGNHVRELGGAGKYTGIQWPLMSEARGLTTTYDGAYVYTIEGDHISVYGKQSAIGSVEVSAVLSGLGEEFYLSGTTSLYTDSAYLIHASQPATLSVKIDGGGTFGTYNHTGLNVEAVSASTKESKANATVFDAPGARVSVVNRFGVRPTPSWTLSVSSTTWRARDELFAALMDQVPLLLRSPIDWEWDLSDGWYSVGDVTDNARVDTRADIQDRLIEMPLTPVKRPVIITSPAWTYDGVLVEFGQLESLEQSGVTWLELLQGDI